MGKNHKVESSIDTLPEAILTAEESVSSLPMAKKVASVEVKTIAIFTEDFTNSISASPNISVQDITSWLKDQIVREKEVIEFLKSINAPIEVFCKVG